MRTRRRRAAPPTDANDLLAALRSARLLSPKQLRQFAVSWSESRPDEPDYPAEGTRLRARELTAAGLLTAWQVDRLLAGEARRLRIGQYLLLDWIGAGGMGVVYKAEHGLMKRVVVLKVLGGPPGPGPQSPVPAGARFRAKSRRRPACRTQTSSRPTTPFTAAAPSSSSWNTSRGST